MPACTMPAFSTRNSTEPPLAPFTALATSMVTVPIFGLGIMPRGPSTLPSRPTSGIRSGVAMQRSKSIEPPCTFSTRSSAPTTSAPAALASCACAPAAGPGRPRLVGLGAAREHTDPHTAAGPVRQLHHATHHLIRVTRIDTEIHRDLDGLIELRLGAVLDHLHRVVDRIELLAIDAFADLG